MLLGGRYRLLSAPLSTGSFGSVFMADDERMPRRVAVKILHPQHAENPTVRARFRRELEAACRVSHENVVAVFDIGEDPNLGLYYVMELVRGTPLKDYLTSEPLPWTFVYRVATQLCRALHAIHTAGIVHRDLKPQNIMLVERSSLDELVKVLDFGIASLKTPEEEKQDVELTGARMVLGTPPYMSPEQTYMRSDRERLGVEVDARSDLYSLGVILYEMAAGRRPFSGDAHDIVVAHRLTKPMPLERMVGVNVPREFAALVMRCLAKDPRERPQSAKEFHAALKECELKSVRNWSEVAASQAADPRDMPTQAEAPALPVEAVPAETEPRITLDSSPRTRSLWAPLITLAVGALVAVAAFMLAPPIAPDSLAVEAVGPASHNAGAQPETAPVDAAALKKSALPPTLAADVPSLMLAADVSVATPSLADSAVSPEVKPAAAEVASVAAAATKVALVITTQPPGALVLVAGQVLGITPVNLGFDAQIVRELELVLKKERYEDLPVVLSIGPELAGQHLVVNQTLVRKKIGPGIGRDPFKDL